jgi:hypothetical protein
MYTSVVLVAMLGPGAVPGQPVTGVPAWKAPASYRSRSAYGNAVNRRAVYRAGPGPAVYRPGPSTRGSGGVSTPLRMSPYGYGPAFGAVGGYSFGNGSRAVSATPVSRGGC